MTFKFSYHSVLKGLVIAAFVALPGVGHAATITYSMLDHGFGNLGEDYGLRLDEDGGTYSVSSNGAFVTLTYDALGGTAFIEGTVSSNADGTLSAVDYTFTELTAFGDGFTATGGSGSLGVFDLDGKLNDDGFATIFAFDGHRIDGDDSTGVLRGWLIGGGTNDWLVRVAVIPLPAALPLFVTGLGFMGLLGWRRKRKAAAAA